MPHRNKLQLQRANIITYQLWIQTLTVFTRILSEVKAPSTAGIHCAEYYGSGKEHWHFMRQERPRYH